VSKPDLSHIIEPLRSLAVPVDDLTLDPRNARKHDERNLQVIKASLLQFNQRLPLVVQRAGMIVRAGNGRLMVARQLGWKHIAAVVADDADEAAKAFALVDNRSAELAEWNDEVLALEFDDLTSKGFEMPGLGWTPEEVETITGKFNVAPGEMPDLSTQTSPFTQATLTMTHSQMAIMRKAIDVSKGNGDFGDTGNPNSNGNAMARICEAYLASQHDQE
jgi:hypothetical protein